MVSWYYLYKKVSIVLLSSLDNNKKYITTEIIIRCSIRLTGGEEKYVITDKKYCITCSFQLIISLELSSFKS